MGNSTEVNSHSEPNTEDTAFEKAVAWMRAARGEAYRPAAQDKVSSVVSLH